MSTTKIIAPEGCPSCSALLYRVNDQLFCPNNIDCPAQCTKRVQNFCKKLKIKGFGEATIDKLGFITINDLMLADEGSYIEAGFSEHMASKLVATLEARLEQMISIPEFLSAMSIPLIGDSAAAKLTNVSSINELVSLEKLKSLGLGDTAAQNLRNWAAEEWPLYEELWSPYLITITKSQTPAKTNGTVCITGKLTDFKSRTEASKYLESLGFEVKTSVTKTTDYLISEDGTRGSSYTKAQSNNIRILTIKELEEIIHNVK